MTAFTTVSLPVERTDEAPDGCDVRLLCRVAGGSMAHFELAAGRTSRAVAHRTVEEIWYVVAGRGELWRRRGEREEIVALAPGVCVTIPLGTHFQFRATPEAALAIIGATIPAWPGDDEAIVVRGPWAPASPSR